jgi:AcrR family transcriptional regulator
MSAEPVARERILESAYDLFSTKGVRAVGIEEVIERAAVAKATLYRHFPSKDELVLAFLRQREVVWTHGWVEAEARKRGSTPEERLLAIFDLFDEWFHRVDFEGCSFVNVLLETPNPEHPVRRASAEHLENIRTVLRSLADEADLRSTDEFARSFHILMKGSIVQAGEGDLDAAKRAKAMARDLIEKYR